jgi:hypothetical protein
MALTPDPDPTPGPAPAPGPTPALTPGPTRPRRSMRRESSWPRLPK